MEKYLELKTTILNKEEIKGPDSYGIYITLHIGMKADEKLENTSQTRSS